MKAKIGVSVGVREYARNNIPTHTLTHPHTHILTHPHTPTLVLRAALE